VGLNVDPIARAHRGESDFVRIHEFEAGLAGAELCELPFNDVPMDRLAGMDL
jgi:hypothetical protein